MANNQWLMAIKYDKSIFQDTTRGAKPNYCQLCDLLGNGADTSGKPLLLGVPSTLLGWCTILS